MVKQTRRKRYYTLMIVPHDAWGRNISLKIPVGLIYSVVGLSIFSILIVSSSIVYSSLLTRRLIHYASILIKNQQQEEMLESFTNRTKEVKDAILELVREDNSLRKILGLKGWRSKIDVASKTKEKMFGDAAETVTGDLKLADSGLEDQRNSLKELKEWVSKVQQRYTYTPSRWPVPGRVVSYFGYRVYPWRGFHSGVDISGMYGAPIRCAAEGFVKYAGWIKGYGKAVIVEHGYGTSTLYAHCSRFAVNAGQRIKKGEVVSYIGNTGYSTGPHLHYEVRKYDQPINPIAYLDLNIVTASRLWSK